MDVDTYCLVVSVRPPAGSALDSTAVSGTMLRFSRIIDHPYDSAQVDVVLR